MHLKKSKRCGPSRCRWVLRSWVGCFHGTIGLFGTTIYLLPISLDKANMDFRLRALENGVDVLNLTHHAGLNWTRWN